MSDNGDGLNHLRIPYEKIKFGEKLEVQGYGTVFRGEFDGQPVALKQLNITNLGNVKPKLLAEILTISRFRQHPNLVALLGFCDEKSNEIILVYEYVSSGNLAEKMRKRLTAIQRLEICLDAARGLDYLHTGVDPATPGIVHGNIKPSKILLNSDPNSSRFEAKVSSFGLSKILPGQTQRTPESTNTADEVTGKVTKEFDVYSFGVLLLEVLCGVSELVDTDDYQERHVTELVPKRLEQNKLRKIVHFDIRKEIKTESLETYAKIACQCVMDNPEERPTMAQVVEELEKALRLQGGEVSFVQIPGSRNVDGAPDGTVVEDDNGVVVDSYIEPEDTKVISVDEDGKTESSGEDNGDEVSTVPTSSASADGEKYAAEDLATQERSFVAPLLEGEDGSHIQDAGEEVTPKENKDEEQIAASSQDHTSTEDLFVNQEGHNSKILDSDNNLPYVEDAGDKLEHLRIPFEKIKIGKKIDVDGYGSMFQGEFDHQQVALKRLNITNLAHVKPTLLAEILVIARFRQHPNIVALLGFCDEKSNEIILVYEYVSDGTLADNMSKHLTTIQRLEICLGAARGLEYLHTGVDSAPGIIHGDIKLSKILLNSFTTSSRFEAKVSGYGLSKLLPGQAQRTVDPTDEEYQVAGTKESDVYSFGVLLLEVLCGVSELVDTDDYQERHVAQLVPKRLEQNMLHKIVHLDIRDEIKAESLETYAKIACQCVMESPEERPTMAQVVEELEKALRLQGTEVSQVPLFRSNGNSQPEEMNEDEDDAEGTEGIVADLKSKEEAGINGENEVHSESMITITPSESNGDGSKFALQGQSFPFPVFGSEEGHGAAEGTDVADAKRDANDAEYTEEKIMDDKSLSIEITKSSGILESGSANSGEEDAFVQGSGILESRSANAGEQDAFVQGSGILESGSGNAGEQDAFMQSLGILESGSANAGEKDAFVQSSGILESGSANAGEEDACMQSSGILESGTANAGEQDAFSNLQDTEKKPELVINLRENDFSDFGNTQESVSKRSDDTCSESSNGDGTTPSDYLLQKSPAKGTNTKKPLTNGSRNCCSCGWWRFFSDRVALYGGRFWNKLVWCFTWIKGKFCSKRD